MQKANSLNVRKLSYDVLYDVLFNDKLLNESINSLFNRFSLSDVDKAYIKRETTGLIEEIDNIDNIISKFSKIKIRKLDVRVLLILRIGVYELMYLDRVPAFATINELVNLTKKETGLKYSAFVNAVLRNVKRSVGEDNDDNLENNGIKNAYFKTFHNNDQNVIDEFNKKKINFSSYVGALDFKYSKVYRANNYRDIITLDSFKEGNILIADASSIYLTDALADTIYKNFPELSRFKDTDINKRLHILDTCASPGGKFLGLVDLLSENACHVEARDISNAKINRILENVKRLKVKNVSFCVKDASKFDNSDELKYDVIICDVPCTGLGVISKKPDIKLHYSHKKMDSLVTLQKEILSVSAKYLKVGGIISYSTCTTTKEENEDVINDFILKHSNYSKIYEKRIKPNDENNADGFYMCFLKKEYV